MTWCDYSFASARDDVIAINGDWFSYEVLRGDRPLWMQLPAGPLKSRRTWLGRRGWYLWFGG